MICQDRQHIYSQCQEEYPTGKFSDISKTLIDLKSFYYRSRYIHVEQTDFRKSVWSGWAVERPID